MQQLTLSLADVTLDIAANMQNQTCIDTMMHLTCTNMPIEKIDDALKAVQKLGIRNILALRGDPPKGQDKFEAVEGGFSCALDLVKHIRKEFGDFFSIAVAGYPEAHPETIVDDPVEMEKNYWSNIKYLKEKIDAGGEVIVTQLFYDIEIFHKFVADCRSVGITCPILPGIMPIMTYGGFKRMTGFCKTKVPKDLADKIESLKDDEEGLKAYGIEHGADMCLKLLSSGTPGLHMYALNVDTTVLAILDRVGLINVAKPPRPVPWSLVPKGTRRMVEGVRPVSWALSNRMYIKRTKVWDSFPAKSWAEAHEIPALCSELRYHTLSIARKAKATAAWGAELKSLEDVKSVFVKYFSGEISTFPWADKELAGSVASTLAPKLTALVGKGLLPINALPSINGCDSADEVHGWGGLDGRVYQKSYVEFFAPAEAAAKIIESIQTKIKALGLLDFIAVDSQGVLKASSEGLAQGKVSAVSWGVFPGKEIIQPYVLDSKSLKARAEEAFALWTAEWGSLYEDGSASRDLLKSISSGWVFIGVLDNDFVSGGDLLGSL
jgi:methylenetetrahydrofolate reductase (NADPH)